MEGYLLGEEEPTNTDTVSSFTDVFERVFPKFLAIGMSEEEFWDKDPHLTRAFIEADKLRLERTNTELWLQGRYVYEAIAACAPVLNAMSKRPKLMPYRKEPYNLTAEKEDKRRYESNKAKMEAFAIGFNKRFGRGTADGGDR